MAHHVTEGVRTGDLHAMIRREVNDRVYGIAVQHRIAETEFLCECAVEGCPAMVRLSNQAYRASRESGAGIVAPGHLA
jgi:hypothetical protein